MRAFVTGGTGFVGAEVVRQMRARGDEVTCLVRSPEKAAGLTALGCEILAGDLAGVAALTAGAQVGKAMGQPPNLRELISWSDGVTFWNSYEKAAGELGYAPRGIEEGLRQTLADDPRLPDPVAA